MRNKIIALTTKLQQQMKEWREAGVFKDLVGQARELPAGTFLQSGS